MSDPLATNLLKLPYLAAAQAQKHVTHNEALRLLDTIVQLAVLDRTLTAPPGSPAEGDRYIVASGATGDWDDEDGNIATFVDGVWAFAEPVEGWLCFDRDSETILVFLSGAWTAAGLPGSVDHLGVNATADTTNRLAVRSAGVLLSGIEAADGGTGDVRVTVNKEAAADTASLLFQRGSSGRAEIGLVGDDDFVFKVSPDGATWAEAIRIDKDTGLPAILYDNAASGLSATTVQDAIDEVAAAGAGGAAAGANTDITSLAAVTSMDGGPVGGWRNLLINPAGRINQRVAAGGIADDTYGHDRWYALTQTGTIAVSTLSDVENGTPSMWRLTQSQATAQRMGYAQIVSGGRCKWMRGKAAVLGGRFRCSSSQAIRYAILEWTGTEDAVTSDVVNSWTNGTFTAGNFFNSTTLTVRAVGSLTPAAATLTDLTALTATLGSSFNNLIVFIWTEGTAAQNVTLDGALQLEAGSVATQREVRPFDTEFGLCLPYYEKSYQMAEAPGSATPTGRNTTPVASNTIVSANVMWNQPFQVRKRATPTVTVYGYQGTSGTVSDGTSPFSDFAASSGGLNATSEVAFSIRNLSGGSLTTHNLIILWAWTADAEL